MTGPGIALLKSLLEGYREGWRRYAAFGGHTSLPRYLSFFVVNFGIGGLLRGLEYLVGDGFFAFLGVLYGMAALLPGLAITVRLLRGIFSRRT